MGKGSYRGGSTVVGPNSGWFTNTGQRPPREPPTPQELAESAEKSARVAEEKREKSDAYMASIQGLPTLHSRKPKKKHPTKKRQNRSKQKKG
jgi:hypothetical protein